MRMGVRAKRVWAMPAVVYCVASSEALTPTKGPNTVAPSTHHIALRSCTACESLAFQSLLNITSSRKKPTRPMVARIRVAAKGTLMNSGNGSTAPSGTASVATPAAAMAAS